MQERYVLRHARILDPASKTDIFGDVLLVDGRLERIQPGLPEDLDAEEIEAEGMWLFPGLVDMHTHLRVPGDSKSETLKTGLQAAIAGGITRVGVMPNTNPPMDSPEMVSRLVESSSSLGLADVVPIPCVTRGRSGRELADLVEMNRAGVMAFSDDGSPVHDSGLLLGALETVSIFGGVIIEHPEITSLSGGCINLGSVSENLGLTGISECSETVDVARCLEIARCSEGALHLTHLSSPRSIDLIHETCFSGADASADVTPHHLALDENIVKEQGAMAKMNPPLRSSDSRSMLASRVSRGMVDAVASDHAPHSSKNKNSPVENAAFGITGLETLLPVTLEVLYRELQMPILDVLGLLTVGPSCVLRIPIPCLREGQIANMVLFDPEMEYTIGSIGSFSKSLNTPFIERHLKGRVEAVWKGRMVYRHGSFT